MTDLIERLHDHARNVGGDDSFERLYGSEANEAADEIAALRARVAVLTKANREAVELIDEINERATSRKFWGISQTIHAKLCTIRITLARAILSKQEPARVEVVDEGESGNAGLR